MFYSHTTNSAAFAKSDLKYTWQNWKSEVLQIKLLLIVGNLLWHLSQAYSGLNPITKKVCKFFGNIGQTLGFPTILAIFSNWVPIKNFRNFWKSDQLAAPTNLAQVCFKEKLVGSKSSDFLQKMDLRFCVGKIALILFDQSILLYRHTNSEW